MTEKFEAGDKVVLTGDGWEGFELAGETVTVSYYDANYGESRFFHKGQEFYVSPKTSDYYGGKRVASSEAPLEKGDRVRLTGESWGEGNDWRGRIVTIAGVDEVGPYFENPGVGVFWILDEGWEAEKVEEPSFSKGGYIPGDSPYTFTFKVSDIDHEALTEAFYPLRRVALPEPDQHPNYVQVYLENERGSIDSFEAHRRISGESGYGMYACDWTIPERDVYDLDDVDGLRLLLDEIEARLLAEEQD